MHNDVRGYCRNACGERKKKNKNTNEKEKEKKWYEDETRGRTMRDYCVTGKNVSYLYTTRLYVSWCNVQGHVEIGMVSSSRRRRVTRYVRLAQWPNKIILITIMVMEKRQKEKQQITLRKKTIPKRDTTSYRTLKTLLIFNITSTSTYVTTLNCITTLVFFFCSVQFFFPIELFPK